MSHLPTARDVALELLGAVLRRKRPLDDAIDDNAAMHLLSGRDRAFARLLVATALRRLGQIDALIAFVPQHAAGATGGGAFTTFSRLGVAQLLFLRTPPHAAVATSVDLAHGRGFLSHKGLVNAVLRRLSVEGPELATAQDAARLNTPDWLWRSWSGAYGEETARAIANAHLKEAPLDLTVRAGSRGLVREAAGNAAADWHVAAAGGRRSDLSSRLCRRRMVGPGRGRCIAGTAVGRCLRARGRRSLRGPGGKSAQLASAGARVIAIDRSTRRLERLVANFRRLGLPIEAVAADALTWRPAWPVEAVLLDAPCTTTGAIRRHPDVPHLKSPDDVARLSVVQENLLRAAVDMLVPGGIAGVLHLLAGAGRRTAADRGAVALRCSGRAPRDQCG